VRWIKLAISSAFERTSIYRIVSYPIVSYRITADARLVSTALYQSFQHVAVFLHGHGLMVAVLPTWRNAGEVSLLRRNRRPARPRHQLLVGCNHGQPRRADRPWYRQFVVAAVVHQPRAGGARPGTCWTWSSRPDTEVMYVNLACPPKSLDDRRCAWPSPQRFRTLRDIYVHCVCTGWAKKVIPLVQCNICTRGITFLAHPVSSVT